ncbi:hypothetical protein DVH24_023327 [Malus domestica]|uniref:Uncharacterized protein n=1 Tax=Malus domestica TaxID=3750 RepID=A0A498KNS0_MALDO|nr:hypothetical protein DVH24_023327 [Malus domestica]
MVLPQSPIQQPSLAIVVAAQNMAMFSQHPSLNLLYNGLMGNVGGRFIHRVVNLGMMAQALNSGQMGGALNPYIFLVSQMGGPHGLSNLLFLRAYGTTVSHPMLKDGKRADAFEIKHIDYRKMNSCGEIKRAGTKDGVLGFSGLSSH